ncbi:hypothetical protein A3A46_00875 [Candidatus Roizmanbacteria bacterium RIFCSPLOWO2_01_FULL_37_13]|uniref:OmpR/PhoB-type domain-containing protein n=1 Tax=Candidatus Roizmanbacteria bacterium RIFCSPHIGHO2_02_FULL_38_11 TaxID=1802039 RepID=A0A1F7H216_9BACT|nr:MAG: hypothetical protein A3C25_02685 [Candidatus Roizmanbacteria bacterium RIFCSPHIGHO2_02_FULL_38_11]OGK41240.1 MAG: hypothetical protein A3A46_00875 [Candidatus Roizmanbacteria bacterium RIFCSPLOWO2_01_FULL_37_13]
MIINTAFSDEYIIEVSKLIFEPLRRGESVFCRFFPGHGRSVRLQQIFLEERYLESGFGEDFKKFIIVRIDASDFAIQQLDHFFLYVKARLMKIISKSKLDLKPEKSDFNKSRPLVFTIGDIINICKRTNEKGLQVLFVIEVGNKPLANEREFYSAWAKIVEANLDKIHTHVNTEIRTPLDGGVLPAVLMQSIVNVPLPIKKECDHFINYYLKLWKMNLTKNDRKRIYEICGYDTWLIKEALRTLRQGKPVNQVLYDPNLLLKARIEWELFSKDEKEVIEIMLAKGRIPRSLEAEAKDLEYANFWDSKHTIPRIIEQIIIQKESAGEMSLNPSDETIHLGSINLSQKFSEIENKIVLKLLESEGKVVKRETIADIIWGKDAEEKYSDWAIDKTMSRLRSRLSLYTGIYRIATKKKAGFLLEA